MGRQLLKRVGQALAEEPAKWFDELARFVPGYIGCGIRQLWMRRRLGSLGRSAFFEVGSVVVGGRNVLIGQRFSLMRNSSLYALGGTIQIGDRVSINANVSINASDGGKIVLGNDVLVGPNVVMRASNHVFSEKDKPINRQGHTGGTIVVQEDVWIGANAVVVPDVTIGAHAVVGAGAVVTRDVEPWSVVGGVPARKISQR